MIQIFLHYGRAAFSECCSAECYLQVERLQLYVLLERVLELRAVALELAQQVRVGFLHYGRATALFRLQFVVLHFELGEL